MIDAVRRWAESREDVRAAVLVGSRARSDRPADAWSDTDVLLLVHDPAILLDDASWPAALGEVGITFVEETPVPGVRERRVLFTDGRDLDGVVLPVEAAAELAQLAAPVLVRGFRVLVDKDGLLDRLAQGAPEAAQRPPSPAAFAETASDFWYHAVWTARKLSRGEVYVARECLDGHMSALTVRVAAWHADGRAPLHGARFLEQWADPRVLEGLRTATSRYERADVARGLLAMMELFSWLAKETAGRLSLAGSRDAEQLARTLVDEALAEEGARPA